MFTIQTINKVQNEVHAVQKTKIIHYLVTCLKISYSPEAFVQRGYKYCETVYTEVTRGQSTASTFPLVVRLFEINPYN